MHTECGFVHFGFVIFIYIFSTLASFECLLEISKSVGLRDNERMINACVKLTLLTSTERESNWFSYAINMLTIKYDDDVYTLLHAPYTTRKQTIM